MLDTIKRNAVWVIFATLIFVLGFQQNHLARQQLDSLCAIRQSRQEAYEVAQAINKETYLKTGELPSALAVNAQNERRNLIGALSYLDC